MPNQRKRAPRPIGIRYTFSDGSHEIADLPEVTKAMFRQLHALAQSDDPATRLGARAKLETLIQELTASQIDGAAARAQRKTAAPLPRPAARAPLKTSIQATMHREKKRGTEFKTFMLRWQQGPISGLRCTFVDGGDYYQIEDENAAEGSATGYKWATLQTYFSKS